MSSYDIYGVVAVVFAAALAVDQGWTVFLIGGIVFALLLFARQTRKDTR